MFGRITAPPAMLAALGLLLPPSAQGQSRLPRRPTLSATQAAFAHGGDLGVADRAGGVARRLTSTPAVESDPHFSPTLLPAPWWHDGSYPPPRPSGRAGGR